MGIYFLHGIENRVKLKLGFDTEKQRADRGKDTSKTNIYNKTHYNTL